MFRRGARTILRQPRAATLVLLGASLLTARPAGAQDARVVMAPFQITGPVSRVRNDIESAALAGFRDAGLAARPGSSVAAEYLLHGKVDSSERGYSIRLAFVRAADSAELEFRERTCAAFDPCPPVPDGVRELAGELARPALARLEAARAAVATGGEAPAATLLAPAGTPNPPPAGIRATSPTPPAGRSVIPWIAGGALAAGVAARGIYLLAVDGRETDCEQTPAGQRCFGLRDTRSAGYLNLAAGGALAIGTFVTYLLVGRSGVTRTSVALTPSGISLARSF